MTDFEAREVLEADVAVIIESAESIAGVVELGQDNGDNGERAEGEASDTMEPEPDCIETRSSSRRQAFTQDAMGSESLKAQKKDPFPFRHLQGEWWAFLTLRGHRHAPMRINVVGAAVHFTPPSGIDNVEAHLEMKGSHCCLIEATTWHMSKYCHPVSTAYENRGTVVTWLEASGGGLSAQWVLSSSPVDPDSRVKLARTLLQNSRWAKARAKSLRSGGVKPQDGPVSAVAPETPKACIRQEPRSPDSSLMCAIGTPVRKPVAAGTSRSVFFSPIRKSSASAGEGDRIVAGKAVAKPKRIQLVGVLMGRPAGCLKRGRRTSEDSVRLDGVGSLSPLECSPANISAAQVLRRLRRKTRPSALPAHSRGLALEAFAGLWWSTLGQVVHVVGSDVTLRTREGVNTFKLEVQLGKWTIADGTWVAVKLVESVHSDYRTLVWGARLGIEDVRAAFWIQVPCDPSEERSSVDLQSRILDRMSLVSTSFSPSASSRSVHWDELVGLQSAKDALGDLVISKVRTPCLHIGEEEAQTGLLLFGPIGAGKTMLARSCAERAEVPFFCLSLNAILARWPDDIERPIRSVFAMARAAAASAPGYERGALLLLQRLEVASTMEEPPDTVVLDSADADAEHAGRSTLRRTPSSVAALRYALLKELDGCPKDEGLFVIGSSASPWALDSAVLARFQKGIYVMLPSLEEAVQLLQRHLGRLEVELDVSGCCLDVAVATSSAPPPKTATPPPPTFAEGLRATASRALPEAAPQSERLGWRQLLEGCSGEDLRLIAQGVKLDLRRRARDATHWLKIDGRWTPALPSLQGTVEISVEALQRNGEGIRLGPATFADVEQAMALLRQKRRPMASGTSLRRYEAWNSKHGCA